MFFKNIFRRKPKENPFLSEFPKVYYRMGSAQSISELIDVSGEVAEVEEKRPEMQHSEWYALVIYRARKMNSKSVIAACNEVVPVFLKAYENGGRVFDEYRRSLLPRLQGVPERLFLDVQYDLALNCIPEMEPIEKESGKPVYTEGSEVFIRKKGKNSKFKVRIDPEWINEYDTIAKVGFAVERAERNKNHFEGAARTGYFF